MESLIEFGIALVLVIGWDWYHKRGKRAANAAEKAEIERLRELGVKMEDD